MKNNTDSRRTQKENDKELLIFEEPYLMIPNDGILMDLFLDVVKNGAEAMDWDVQDPPRICCDLEGAWWLWKKGGSASPWIDGEDEN